MTQDGLNLTQRFMSQVEHIVQEIPRYIYMIIQGIQ